MQIPTKIKIGGFRYKVITCAEEDDKKLPKNAAGIFDPEKGFLALRKGFEPYMFETLLHEILHAINSEIEEETIEYLAQALYQVIADNPSVFALPVQSKRKKKAGVAHGRRNK